MEELNYDKNKRNTLKGFILGVALSLAVFCLFQLIVNYIIPADTPSSIASANKIKEVESVIDQNYMGETDKQEMTDYMFLGLVAGLNDRYSTYYTKEEYEDVSSVHSGYFEGIGVEIGTDSKTGDILILKVFEDAPADRAGMMKDDVILSVNGIDMTGKTAADVIEVIRNDETGTIQITALRDGEKMDFTMTREKVLRNPVVSEILDNDTGYIKIGTFDSMTAEEFETELESLKEAGVKGLILDLRENLGGLVNAACDTLRAFMPEGLLVYTENKYGERREYTCDGKNELDLPMAVLVNGNTASSAEIFSGAVQDAGVGEIIGTQTFGKGIVQNAFTLTDGSVVKLTVEHYYTPDGHDIHGKGITPDILVEEEDGQLDAALSYLKEKY